MKAFVTVNIDMLFLKLWEKGIQGKAWRLVKGLYSQVNNKVIFGPFESSWFEVAHGVKQGCILSPTLFSLVMQDLIDMLNDKNFGIPLNGTKTPGLLYADDVVLIGESEESLTKMLNVSHVFVSKWGMSFNYDKSKV